VIATKDASPGYNTVSSSPSSFVFAQDRLRITNSVLEGYVARTIKLTNSGGRGSLSYSVSGPNCSIISPDLLTASSPTTCVVTANTGSIGGYLGRTSDPVSFVFRNTTQSKITITSSSATILPTDLTYDIKYIGGSGEGAVLISVTGDSCAVSFNRSIYATKPTTCVVTVKKSASAGYEEAISAPVSFIFGTFNQEPLYVRGTQSLNVASEAKLWTTGGTMFGKVTFSVVSGNCSINDDVLTALTLNSCTVIATKAADVGVNAVTSAPFVVDFKVFDQKYETYLFNNVSSKPAGQTYTLNFVGGSGTGIVTYSVTGANCSINGNVLTSTSATTCTVTATKAASTFYNAKTTPPANYVFVVASQDPLFVKKQTFDANGSPPPGASYELMTTGGSGSGNVTFSVTGSSCSITGNVLTASPPSGTQVLCDVTATKGPSLGYSETTSNKETFRFINYIQQPEIFILNSNFVYKYWDNIRLAVSGGSGNGQVSYQLTPESSLFCSLNSGFLKSQISKTKCFVVATKKGSGVYLDAVSKPATFTFD
jgi:hypothetical protein